MGKRKLLYEGKAKKAYAAWDPKPLIASCKKGRFRQGLGGVEKACVQVMERLAGRLLPAGEANL